VRGLRIPRSSIATTTARAYLNPGHRQPPRMQNGWPAHSGCPPSNTPSKMPSILEGDAKQNAKKEKMSDQYAKRENHDKRDNCDNSEGLLVVVVRSRQKPLCQGLTKPTWTTATTQRGTGVDLSQWSKSSARPGFHDGHCPKIASICLFACVYTHRKSRKQTPFLQRNL
jgi:hypothetical protein